MTDKIRCLLVDDDPDDQEIFLMALNRVSETIDCKIAGNGVDAINMLQSAEVEMPHYLFIDINMPKMNGLLCLEKLREIGIEAPEIYMYSTTADPQIVQRSSELGAGFIIKPYSINELQEKLSAILIKSPGGSPSN